MRKTNKLLSLAVSLGLLFTFACNSGTSTNTESTESAEDTAIEAEATDASTEMDMAVDSTAATKIDSTATEAVDSVSTEN